MVQVRRTTRRRRKNSKSNRKGDPTSPKSKRRYTRRKVKRHSPRRATTPPFKLNPSAPKKRKYAKRLGKTKMKGGLFEGLFKNKDTSIVDSMVDTISKYTPEQLEEFKQKIDKIPGLKESLLAPLNKEPTGTVANASVLEATDGDTPVANADGDKDSPIDVNASVTEEIDEDKNLDDNASVASDDDAADSLNKDNNKVPDVSKDDISDTESVESIVETNQKEKSTK